MKTLIELYDERPVENVLATEVFKPEKTVFLCNADIAADKALHERLRGYFRHKGIRTEAVFLETAMYRTDSVLAALNDAVADNDDCVLDITGGTDAALFACGVLNAKNDIPAFTYSRRRNKFFRISGAPFEDALPCTVRHSVEDCFRMAGGSLKTGRVEKDVVTRYLPIADNFFSVYLSHRTAWTRAVGYIVLASQPAKGELPSLSVSAPIKMRSGGRENRAPEDILYALADIGMLKDLDIRNGTVRFAFADEQIRAWLRDIGSVLELYVYKTCIGTGLFHDVRLSAVVDWEASRHRDGVTNEIDVMAMQGIVPAFISCKTCAVTTEALNELAVLRGRFGGKAARAAIVTSTECQAVTRHRAAELSIDVIDLTDLKANRLSDRIHSLMRID